MPNRLTDQRGEPTTISLRGEHFQESEEYGASITMFFRIGKEVSWRTCPACLGSRTSARAQFSRLPILLFPVDKEVRHEVPRRPLKIRICNACGHEFALGNPQRLLREIYNKWYRYYPMHAKEIFDRSYRTPMDHAITDALSAFSNETASILEIGANNPQALTWLSQLGHDVVGVAPDAPANDSRFLRGNVEDLVTSKKFNLIIAKFTLEHVVNLDAHLKKIRSLLSEGGLFLFQIPNCEQWKRQGIDSYFAHEHRHYFSGLSARFLLHRNGFRYEFKSQDHDPSIILLAREDKVSRVQSPKALEVAVADASRSGETVLYGAGLPLLRWVYSEPKRRDTFRLIRLVDDNESLHGRFLPGTNLMVEAPKIIENRPENTVIVTANPTHHEAIQARIVGIAPDVDVVMAS